MAHEILFAFRASKAIFLILSKELTYKNPEAKPWGFCMYVHA